MNAIVPYGVLPQGPAQKIYKVKYQFNSFANGPKPQTEFVTPMMTLTRRISAA